MSVTEVVYQHIVPNEEFGRVRFCDYCGGVFAGLPTKSSVKKAIGRKELFIDGEIAVDGRFVVAGQLIEWRQKTALPSRLYDIDVPVVFEDDYMAVVNKPAGIVVSGNLFQTLENALPNHLKVSQTPDALVMPRAIHRLDKDTSGLVIVGKTASAHLRLSNMLAHQEIRRFYTALVIGEPLEQGVFSFPVDGKKAVTHYEVIKRYDSLVSGVLSLMKVELKTGRTHQIRKHFSEAGFPILGDKIYGQPGFILKNRGLFLSASQLVLKHPITSEMLVLTVDLARKFTKFPEGEQERFDKYKKNVKKHLER